MCTSRCVTRKSALRWSVLWFHHRDTKQELLRRRCVRGTIARGLSCVLTFPCECTHHLILRCDVSRHRGIRAWVHHGPAPTLQTPRTRQQCSFVGNRRDRVRFPSLGTEDSDVHLPKAVHHRDGTDWNSLLRQASFSQQPDAHSLTSTVTTAVVPTLTRSLTHHHLPHRGS